MKARITNPRRARHHQNPRQYVLEVPGVTKKADAAKLLGKNVVWKTGKGAVIKGRVTAAHGNNGKVRITMERGLPGQAIGTDAELKA